MRPPGRARGEYRSAQHEGTTTGETEAVRQQALLRLLWRLDPPGSACAGIAGDADRIARGLRAYRANAGALAERALGAAFPTVAELIGAESMSALARAFWRAHPPARGDLAQWGAALPDFIAAAPDLASEPYLADVARLDWAVHEAATAEDLPPGGGAPAGLPLLADADPAALVLRLAPGAAVVESAHPAASIWLAHRSDAADRFEPVRAALASGEAECAFVWRCGWKARVAVVDPSVTAFLRASIVGADLESALAAAGAAFDFEAWLVEALRNEWLGAVDRLDARLAVADRGGASWKAPARPDAKMSR